MKLRIEKPIYGGAGLAREEGKAIFVPFALPGELVEASIANDHGSYAEAQIENILEASRQRAQPQCPYFGVCGGCHYQHANYLQQVEMKTQILREALERARLIEIPEIGTLSGEPLGYRNRIRLHIDRANGRLCYKMRGSHQNLAVDDCPIAAPVLERALRAIQSATQLWQLGNHFTEVELFTNAAQDSILLTLWAADDGQSAARELKRLWPELRSAVPEAVGATVFSSERGKLTGRLLAQTGDTSLNYAAAGHSYSVGAGSFFQVNRFLIDLLVEHVIKGHAGGVAWDFYAGVGLFSVALARSFEQIVAVESGAGSARDLRRNLVGGPHRIVAGSTIEFLRRARTRNEKAPDLAVVDPPRTGLGKGVTKLLAEIRPAHITYVSCDPATLSRDLKSLLDSGYHLSTLRMVDLFPQTFHLESVATLLLK
ncbi:MAG TPA: 23S rRNA (uracil(1939)-C(5))-methyltransferase RlmD [Silvibacterium sp.]|nr:23S rRNA (uracil(1939)-C(5))-methyltransferase RlmD [Silvibacterium sp.]